MTSELHESTVQGICTDLDAHRHGFLRHIRSILPECDHPRVDRLIPDAWKQDGERVVCWEVQVYTALDEQREAAYEEVADCLFQHDYELALIVINPITAKHDAIMPLQNKLARELADVPEPTS